VRWSVLRGTRRTRGLRLRGLPVDLLTGRGHTSEHAGRDDTADRDNGAGHNGDVRRRCCCAARGYRCGACAVGGGAPQGQAPREPGAVLARVG
jgi:hypothetical protein